MTARGASAEERNRRNARAYEGQSFVPPKVYCISPLESIRSAIYVISERFSKFHQRATLFSIAKHGAEKSINKATQSADTF